MYYNQNENGHDLTQKIKKEFFWDMVKLAGWVIGAAIVICTCPTSPYLYGI